MITNRSHSGVDLKPNDNVLIIAASHTGNNMFCTPTIHFLKKTHPDVKITVVALKKLSAQVFENSPSISQLLIIDKPDALKNIAGKFALAICLNEKSAFLLQDVEISKRIIGRFKEDRHHADQILEFMSDIVNRETSKSDRCYQLASKTPEFLGDVGFGESIPKKKIRW